MAGERTVNVRARTVALVVAVVLAFALALEIVIIARQVIVWIFISALLTLAINPLVERVQRLGIRRRGLAVMIAYLAVLAVIAGLAATFLPILVDQIQSLVNKIPQYVEDLTNKKGPLGFLERDYHIVERVKEAVKDKGAGDVLGVSNIALSAVRGVISAVVAVVTIVFMTLFMLLEGPAWIERFLSLLSPKAEKRWRTIGHDFYHTVGGYVAGNLAISLIAGTLSAIVLAILGVPYSVALGLVVALLDLIPLAGATIAAVIVTTIAFFSGLWIGVIVLVFFVVYQQIENQLLQPLIYGKTVQLSPLAVLIAVLVGAKLGGVVGALAAIPVAGGIQIVLRDMIRVRQERQVGAKAPAPVET